MDLLSDSTVSTVTDSLMETDDRGENDGGRRGNLKERMPERGTESTE
jgi:hypothetical protein